MYNTETAEFIIAYSNNGSFLDFSHFEEALYRTKKGQFFLAGEGGPMTKYAEQYGSITSGSSNIFLFSDDEAIDWLHQYQFTVVLEKYFPDAITEG